MTDFKTAMAKRNHRAQRNYSIFGTRSKILITCRAESKNRLADSIPASLGHDGDDRVLALLPPALAGTPELKILPLTIAIETPPDADDGQLKDLKTIELAQ